MPKQDNQRRSVAINLLGCNRSSSAARISGTTTFALSSDSPSFPEQIILMSPKDLLIIFSFPPYSRQTVEAAKQAKELGVPIISFTDKKTAPIVEYCEHYLIAKTDNILFTNSLGAISVLMNALVTELAFTEEEKVLDGLQKIDKYINDKRYFY